MGVDDRLDPALEQRGQLDRGLPDRCVLVPVGRRVDEHLRVEHEDVLVHQRPAELVDLDRPADRLDGAQLRTRASGRS